MGRFVAIGGVALIIAVMQIGPTEAQQDDQGKVAALQTEVAELQTKVADRDDRLRSKSTQISNLKTAVAEAEATSTAPDAGSGESSAYLGGSALDLLPAGAASELEIVVVGPYDRYVLPLILRNNSSQVLDQVTVSAIAWRSDGTQLAVGGDLGFSPSVLRPGDYAFGVISFGRAFYFPDDDASYEFEVKGEEFTEIEPLSRVDLKVVEAGYIGNGLEGELINDSDATVGGPIGVSILCLDSSGAITYSVSGFTEKDEAAAGESVPFQLTFFGGPDDSTNFLVAGSGFNP